MGEVLRLKIESQILVIEQSSSCPGKARDIRKQGQKPERAKTWMKKMEIFGCTEGDADSRMDVGCVITR